MDLSLLRHQSDSRYCFAVDESHVLIRLAVSKLIKLDDVQVIYGEPTSFTPRHFYLKMEIKHTDQAFNYYEAIINTFPSRLMYVFYLVENGQKYYFAESGLFTSYIFDLAFISAYQFVGENRNDFVKEKPSWQGRVFYQIFPDRFAKSSLVDKSYVNSAWDNKDLGNYRNAFLGGDLYGIIDKLEYLKDLGISALYLTPIHPSTTNHNYDVIDYFDVNANFGGKEAFRLLVEKAHDLDIKIMMDMVFNHMGANHPYFQDVVKYGKASKYYDWFFISGDKPTLKPINYLTFGHVGFMPKLDTNNKEVQHYLIKVGEYWLKEYDIDGYRLDVSEGVSHDFWIRFKIALKDIKPDILVIGENWLNAESYLGNDEFDSVMNYPFLGVVSSYLLRLKDAEETSEALEGLLMRYKDGHNRQMMNILASHDIQRVTSLCNGDISLSLLAYAIMVFYLGYPNIYYGEEIFMEGKHDPDNRRGMEWKSPLFESEEHRIFKDLLHLRKEDALAVGDIEITANNGLLKIKRNYKNDGGYVLFVNLTGQPLKAYGNIIMNYRVNQNNEILDKGFMIIRNFD